MKRWIAYLGVAIVGSLVAWSCGEDSMSQEDATSVYTAASTAAGQVSGQVMAQAMAGGKMEAQQVGAVDITFDESSFAGSVTNPSGGSATFAGTLGDVTGSSFNYDFEMDFINWKDAASDITLNGALFMSVQGSGLMNYKMVYTGAIDVSGSIEGTADFELTMSLSEGSISVVGTVAGQAISVGVEYDIPNF